VSNFEHENFGINGKYSKKNYENPNYYASLVGENKKKGTKHCVDNP